MDPAVTRDAVAKYHDLLTRGRAGVESLEILDRLQTSRGLSFGGRPLCTALRPRFLTHEQYRFVRRTSQAMHRVYRTLYHRAMADATLRSQFRLTEVEEQLLAIEPGFADPSPTSRMDAFYDGDRSLLYTEYNTETPAGASYSDSLIDVFYTLPAFQEFQRDYHVTPNPCQPGVLHAILSTYREWCESTGTREPLRVAILDWREVATFSEFLSMYDYLRSSGVEVAIADPRECEWSGGKLYCGNFQPTFIYKRVIIKELVERGGLDHPVIQAAQAGAVCLMNHFRCKILFKKASLAVLSDERNTHLFDDDARKLVQTHVPWTRVVERRNTEFRSATIDLVQHVLDHPEGFVLKPNDDYGGRGIVLGWRATPAEWQAAVELSLTTPTVVQERITLPSEEFPHADASGDLQFSPRTVDTNPYISGSVVGGCLTRISTDDMVNVTAGTGSTLPTFLIDPR